jgi:hypothetical protein
MGTKQQIAKGIVFVAAIATIITAGVRVPMELHKYAASAQGEWLRGVGPAMRLAIEAVLLMIPWLAMGYF